MSVTAVFVALSVVLVLTAAPPYIIDTVRGKTKPERATWMILSVLGVIAFVSQIKLGATWSLCFSGLDTAGSMTVLGLSFKYGVGGFEKQDKIALSIAALGLAISLIARQPIIALSGTILADASGMSVTIRKVFLEPKSETGISWLLFGISAVCGLLSAPKWSLGIVLYPIYLAIANLSVPGTQLLSHSLRRRSAAAGQSSAPPSS